MPRIKRVITYEGSEEWLKTQLGRSLPDGIKELPLGRIEVATVANPTTLWQQLRAWWAL
jgi:hypothetical protein